MSRPWAEMVTVHLPIQGAAQGSARQLPSPVAEVAIFNVEHFYVGPSPGWESSRIRPQGNVASSVLHFRRQTCVTEHGMQRLRNRRFFASVDSEICHF